MLTRTTMSRRHFAALVPAIVVLPGNASRAIAQTDQVTPAASAWSDLDLPELDIIYGAEALEGVPESIVADRYLLTVTGDANVALEHDGGVMFVRLPEGVSMEDALGAAPADGPPSWYYEALLPGGTILPAGEGGSSATTIIDLAPGEWFAAGAQLSRPPVPFTVTGEMPANLTEPASNATVTMSDFAIEVTSGSLREGENVVRLENTGVQPHFVSFQQVPDGTTAENIGATLEGEMTGTPGPGAVDFTDIVPIATSSDLSTNTTMWMTVTFDPGTYVGLCFIPDPGSGMPHAMMGMYAIFTVEAAG
ncbi:MAG: hypothetical protein M3457_20330 [Chloroflexota bacterium]|nr:hypothetical protein [Chloroflexota bacterium]